MNLQDLDKKVFAIRPWRRGASQACSILHAQIHLAMNRTTDKKAQCILRGYQSTINALVAIAIAVENENHYDSAGEHLLLAYELAENSCFTRGWSKKERKAAFEIDYAILQYLDGSRILARESLRTARYHCGVVAHFVAATLSRASYHPIQPRLVGWKTGLAGQG